MFHKFVESLGNLKLTQFTSHVIFRQTVALHDSFKRQVRSRGLFLPVNFFSNLTSFLFSTGTTMKRECLSCLTDKMTLIGSLHFIIFIRCAKYLIRFSYSLTRLLAISSQVHDALIVFQLNIKKFQLRTL